MAVTLSVVGPDGKAVTGLTAANFRAALDDAQLPIDSVQSGVVAHTNTSILLLVDVSGSMQGAYIDQARRSLQEFVNGLDPEDRVALMTFHTSVTLLQDYTADRALLTQAISKLTPLGDTALYDAVLQATAKAATAPPGRRLVVLLSDGTATTGLDKRAASVAAARANGVGIVALGLGAGIDRQYLTEIATASGGRFLEAPTTAVLRQAYIDLASTIRSQYTLSFNVPPDVDRTVQTKLTVHATLRADNAMAERILPPLAGALPPALDLKVNGLSPGQSLSEPVTLDPIPASAPALTEVQYALDGEVIHTATSAPLTYEFDPAALAPGPHTLKVSATDQRGRRGEAQVPFVVASPVSPRSIPLVPIAAAAVAAALAGLLWLILKRRPRRAESYKSRLGSWSGRPGEPGAGRVADWPEPAPPAPFVSEDRVFGRIVIMNESAVINGQLEGIREHEIRATPLSIGSGAQCDIRVEDSEGRIAAEEARVWVQKGRLVYHKLTTLSAMATEGVTSGWIILDSGEDMILGPYRLVFQAIEPEPEVMEETDQFALPQEHGMRLQSVWTRRPEEEPPLPAHD
jgi:VWFA-related protein